MANNVNDRDSANNSDYQFESKMTVDQLFPFKQRLISHNQNLIQYAHDVMTPALRFVYCSDGSVKFTRITDEEKFRSDILKLQSIENEGYSSLKAYLELIINGLNETDKGIGLNDTILKHALTDLINQSKFTYYNEPLRIIQKFMDDHIHSEQDIRLIWTMMEDNGFYIPEEDEPDYELRTEYVNNLGLILVLSICQRQIESWEDLQSELSKSESDNLGVLMDLLIVAISQGRTGKSTFFQNIGLNKYHTDNCQIMAKGKHRSPKTAFFQPSMGKLISELCELKITPDNIEEIKENLSMRIANYAKIYEDSKDYPLTSVYVASSNHTQFLEGMANYGRFAPIYHKDFKNLVPYKHDENGICLDDYFIRILAEGLYLVTKLGKTWKDYYTDHMKALQKELAKSVSYRSSSFDDLLAYLEESFKRLKESLEELGPLDSFDDEPPKLLKKTLKDGFMKEHGPYYDKKDLNASWNQLEQDMDRKTGRQQYGYVLKRIHDVDDNYNLTHDYILKIN